MLHRVRHGRHWVRAIGAATAALAAAGCYDGFDPLDPEVLAEIARSRGDAQGIERSGVYVGRFDVIECGCGELVLGFDLSLCSALERLEGFGLEPVLDLELVQADGTVRIETVEVISFQANGPVLPVFYGPLQADGRLSVAGVLQADAIAVQGQVLGRIDGVVERMSETDEWALVAEYQQRYAVDLLAQPEVLDIGVEEGEVQSVDCRERLALDLRWASPPYEPIDGI